MELLHHAQCLKHHAHILYHLGLVIHLLLLKLALNINHLLALEIVGGRARSPSNHTWLIEARHRADWRQMAGVQDV